MSTELITYQSRNDKQGYLLPEALWLLAKGQAVSLNVNDPRAKPSRKSGKVILFIAPLSMYMKDTEGFLFSLEGGGCTAARIKDLRASDLQLIGLGATSAKMLIDELHKIIGETDAK